MAHGILRPNGGGRRFKVTVRAERETFPTVSAAKRAFPRLESKSRIKGIQLTLSMAVVLTLSSTSAVFGQGLQIFHYTGAPMNGPNLPPPCPSAGAFGVVTATLILNTNPTIIAASISGGGFTYQGLFQGDFDVQNGQVLAMTIAGGDGATDGLAATQYIRNPPDGGDEIRVGIDGASCEYSSSPQLGTWSSVPLFQTPIPKTLGGVNPPANPASRADPFSGSLSSCASTPNAYCGDPINSATGNHFQSEGDFVGGVNTELAFTRYYNSQDGTTGGLGVGWHSTYHRGLAYASSAVVVTRADGREDLFTNSTNVSGVWTSDPDVTSVLTPVPASGVQSGWALTLADDTVENYTLNGQLTSIIARGGLTTILSYNAGNQLTAVTGPFGQILTFTYDGEGRLQQMTTPDGKSFEYAYDGNNNLISATYPDGTIRQYVYENTSFANALTGIIDEDGNRFATWTYDSSGRGISSQHAGGADLTTIVYNADGSSTVTNALGQQMTYNFATLQGIPKVIEIDRLATGTTSAATQKFTYDANGFVASATDWNGNLTTYVNDTRGEPIIINEAVGTPQARTTNITYLSNYHLPTEIVTPGLTTHFVYDSSGDLLTKTLTDTTTTTVPYSTKGTARTWTYTWSDFLLASAQGPRTDVKELTKYTYDNSGALTTTTNALNQVTKVTQHLASGLPLIIVDPNGVTTTLTYDARLRLLTSTLSTSAGPLTTSDSYDAAGNLMTTMLPDGSALTNTYDTAHRLTAVTDLFSANIAYTLDALGDRTQTQVSNSTSVVQKQHSATFDALGRILQDIGGVGQTTRYTYDSNGNPLTITDPLSHVTQQTFDALNRTIRAVDPGNGVTTSTYDAHNRPLTVVDPNGGSTTYVYDGFGDVIQRISPDTGKTVYHYDLAGNLTQSIDARGATANYTYDALDRALTTTYPADAAENVSTIYDQSGNGFGVGRLTSVTDAAGSLSRSYDERGNILSEHRTSGRATLLTSNTYDKASRVSSITYPSGWSAAYSRDVMGRVTAINAQPPGGTPASMVSNVGYQAFGPVNGLTYGNSIAETWSYDLDYRTTHLADTGTTSVQNLAYGYDAANNVLSIADGVNSLNSQSLGYDAMNRLSSAAGSYGTLGYTYNSIGNRLTQTSDGLTTGYVYAPHGNQLTAIKTSSMTFSVSGYIESNPGWPSGTITGTITAGSCTSITLGEQCTIRAISVKDSYSGKTITNPGTSVLIFYGPGTGNFAGEWGISPAITNGIFTLSSVLQGSAGQPNSGWVYTTGPCPGPPTCNGNTYGGLYSITPATIPTVTQTVGNNAAGNVKSFSPAFGQVTSLTYNQAGRLATTSGSAGKITQYTYDAFGHRLVKVGAATATSIYSYDASGHLLQETDDLGDARVDYIYLNDRPVATIQPGNNAIYFLHDDRLGTPQRATNSSQALAWTTTYQPFGQTSTLPALMVQDLRFPGQENDLETGLYHNGFRDYASALGRYMESDPIGLGGGMNTYAYVGDNPGSRSDPLGLMCTAGLGCYTTPAERSAARSGNYLGYYQLACAGGDAYACYAEHIAADDTAPGHLATWWLRRNIDKVAEAHNQCADDAGILNQVRQDLATAYANYLPSSPTDARWPSALDISQIHWDEFAKYGLPPSAFGGTPLGSGVGPILPSVWCPNCQP
jgi:RHS repeat-associated protein